MCAPWDPPPLKRGVWWCPRFIGSGDSRRRGRCGVSLPFVPGGGLKPRCARAFSRASKRGREENTRLFCEKSGVASKGARISSVRGTRSPKDGAWTSVGAFPWNASAAWRGGRKRHRVRPGSLFLRWWGPARGSHLSAGGGGSAYPCRPRAHFVRRLTADSELARTGGIRLSN